MAVQELGQPAGEELGGPCFGAPIDVDVCTIRVFAHLREPLLQERIVNKSKVVLSNELIIEVPVKSLSRRNAYSAIHLSSIPCFRLLHIIAEVAR